MAEYASGNIYIREMRLAKNGDAIDGHTHNFDHTTYLLSGSVHIERRPAGPDGKPLTDKADVITLRAEPGGNFALIEAHYHHKITALEDGCLLHCVYAHRSPQGEVVQSPNGWTEAYI